MRVCVLLPIRTYCILLCSTQWFEGDLWGKCFSKQSSADKKGNQIDTDFCGFTMWHVAAAAAFSTNFNGWRSSQHWPTQGQETNNNQCILSNAPRRGGISPSLIHFFLYYICMYTSLLFPLPTHRAPRKKCLKSIHNLTTFMVHITGKTLYSYVQQRI